MSDGDNVIPFRRRAPSQTELDVYRQITRNWHPEVKQVMFPEYFRQEEQQKK